MSRKYLCLIIAFCFSIIDLAVANDSSTCDRKRIENILKNQTKIDPDESEIDNRVETCKILESASKSEDRCSRVVARASLIQENIPIDEITESDVNDRQSECTTYVKAAASSDQCAPAVIKSIMTEEGVEITEKETRNRIQSCKANQFFRNKIFKSFGSGNPDPVIGEKNGMDKLEHGVELLKKIEDSNKFLELMNENWTVDRMFPVPHN